MIAGNQLMLRFTPIKNRSGWSRIAEIMSKVPEYATFPQFRKVNVKNLLYYQEELQLLQEQIEAQQQESSNTQRYDLLGKNGNTLIIVHFSSSGDCYVNTVRHNLQYTCTIHTFLTIELHRGGTSAMVTSISVKQF